MLEWKLVTQNGINWYKWTASKLPKFQTEGMYILFSKPVRAQNKFLVVGINDCSIIAKAKFLKIKLCTFFLERNFGGLFRLCL